MKNVTYGIDDGHSNVISSGLSEREVEAVALRTANRLGKPVYWYRETRTEQEITDEVYPDSTEVAPSQRTEDAWWTWYDARPWDHEPSSASDEFGSRATARAEARCAAWVAGESDDGPEVARINAGPALANRYRVEVRGTFGGSIGGWRPAITGTLNQTGRSDEDASSTPSADEAAEYAELVIENGALREDVRIVEIAI